MKVSPLSVLMFLSGTFILVISLHSIDLAWNMSNAPQCIDTNFLGTVQNKTEMYLKGFQGIIMGWSLLLGGYMLILYSSLPK